MLHKKTFVYIQQNVKCFDKVIAIPVGKELFPANNKNIATMFLYVILCC